MTIGEVFKLKISCITEEELEDIKNSSCCYRVEKIGSSLYEPKDFYKIVFWEEDDIEVAVV